MARLFESVLPGDGFTYPNIIALASAIVTIAVITTAIYRLYLHPLAKFPGPFWARLTTFPSYWHTLKGDRHVWLWRLQQQYGTTFRYRPDGVLINTPTGYRTIFGPKGNVRKSDYYRVWPADSRVSNTWNATDVHTHAPKRRVLNHAFSDKALRSAEPFVQSNTDRWCELILDRIPKQGKDDGWSKSLNMAQEINHLVFDILGDLCFGKSFEMKEPSSKMRYVPELLADFLVLMHPIAFSPFADWWVWLKPRGLDALISYAAPPALVGWQNFVAKCLQDRTKVEEEVRNNKREARKDFFYYLFDAKDPETGKGYSREELYNECELLIIAGSDTTSIVMSAMMFYLARNPEIQTKLAKEISENFESAEEIQSGTKLQSCKYLRAFIQEASRMTPPVAAEPARQVRPGGTTVEGNFFPEGTKLSTGLYCLSYSESVFPDPFSFQPSRWIKVSEGGAASEESLALAESGFCAFSTGSRGCIGKNLAWLEMMIVMAKVVWNFEVRQDPKNDLGAGDLNGKEGRRCVEQYQVKDAFVAMRDGPMVQFRRRVHS
ncbi:Cytochrome P450 monooxygenase [Pseudocercospora fuligena]|uniref:Cytochrome P450 monooxygenase n=1 Tax=Pseudocercospora fuligena TaxID=685502 RepID=A0A8H6R5G8_9PEZI|nr:Cytochrome P450 monooxygenase [Pseudocercospora fuligena]